MTDIVKKLLINYGESFDRDERKVVYIKEWKRELTAACLLTLKDRCNLPKSFRTELADLRRRKREDRTVQPMVNVLYKMEERVKLR